MNILLTIGILVLTGCVSARFGEGILKTTFLGRDYTTTAKGIAILLIILGHCSGHWPGGRWLTPCGGIGVAMFLITSGYGLNESYKNSGLKDFWKKRLGRMYLPYVIVVIIYAIVQQWDIEKIALNLSCYHSPYWFVTYIVECYIIFWVVSRLLPRYRIPVFGLVSIVSLFVMPELQAEQALSFVCGVLLSDRKEKVFALLDEKRAYVIVCFVLLAIGIFFLGIKQLPWVRENFNAWQMNVIQLLVKFPIGLFLLFVIKRFKQVITNPFVHLGGVISYELYLVHFPFYVMIGTRLWPAWVLIAMSFAVGYGFYQVNNRMHQNIISIK